MKKQIKELKQDEEIRRAFYQIAKPILDNELFQTQKKYIQHGSTSVYDHVISVAFLSFKYAYNKKGNYDLNALVRGALLHDFFLYDWHIYDHKNGHERFHGFTHPLIAMNKASREFHLSIKEKNIIRSHMWPLTLFHMPMSKEAWIVLWMDKVQSTKEINSRKKPVILYQV